MDDFYFLFLKLLDKELDQKIWEIWVHKLSSMTSSNYVSYDEMLKMAKQGNEKTHVNGVYIDQVFL